MFRRFSDALSFLFKEGSWSIKLHESEVLDAALKVLSPSVRDDVRKQLDQDFFVERVPDGRINVFRFYMPREHLRLRGDEFQDALISVRFKVSGRQQRAHVTIYKGYIFSVEFKKPSKFYEGKRLEVIDAEFGEPSQSYTQAIDRLEHGAAD